MAGGTGKYNTRLITQMAEAATAGDVGRLDAEPPWVGGGHDAASAGPVEVAGRDDDLDERVPLRSRPGRQRPGSRHAYVLGPPEDPGPHPALVVSDWVRHGEVWNVQVVWYSEASTALVQQWLPASALMKAPT